MVTRTPRRRSLRPLFDDLNRRYWSGRLPRYRVRRRPLPGNMYGRCEWKKQTISMSSRMIRRGDHDQERRTLLHEMCHISAPGHGRRFQDQLARLAKLGEGWAEEQRRTYAAEPLPLTKAALVGTLEDWLLDVPELRSAPWSRVRVALAHSNGLSVRDLYKRYPTLRQTWLKLPRRIETLRKAIG